MKISVRLSTYRGYYLVQIGNDVFRMTVNGYCENIGTVENMPGWDSSPPITEIPIGIVEMILRLSRRPLIISLKEMVQMFETHINGEPGPDDAADRWDRARALLNNH